MVPKLERVYLLCRRRVELAIRTPTGLHHPFYSLLILIGIRDIDKHLLGDAALFPSDIQDDAPFFPLVEQISSLLFNNAFPSLRYIRDLSRASHSMRAGLRPETRILKFWSKILARCGEQQVWLEDFRGVNITSRDLKRAGLAEIRDPL